MSKKSLERQKWLKTRQEFADSVNAVLKEKNLSITEVCEQSGIPLYVVENITLARNYCLIGNLRHLAAFLGKRLKLELTDD